MPLCLHCFNELSVAGQLHVVLYNQGLRLDRCHETLANGLAKSCGSGMCWPVEWRWGDKGKQRHSFVHGAPFPPSSLISGVGIATWSFFWKQSASLKPSAVGIGSCSRVFVVACGCADLLHFLIRHWGYAFIFGDLLNRCLCAMVQAPEVFKKVASTEADMWSLGMMMYFMVANRFPFWYWPSLFSAMQLEIHPACCGPPVLV